MYLQRRTARRWSGRRLALGLIAAIALSAALPASAGARVASQTADCSPPSADQVEAIARDYFTAFNTGDVAALDALLAPDYQHHGAIVTPQDRALHLDRLREVRTAFPDGTFTIEWLIVDGDTAVVRDIFRGTQQGTYTGIAATGRPVAVSAFHVHRVACGRIVETWNEADGVGMFRQLGVLPGPSTTPPDQEPHPSATTQRTPCPTTTRAQNIAAARRWVEDVMTNGRLEVLETLLAEDIVHHASINVDLVGRQDTSGFVRAILAGFPDLAERLEAAYAVDDMVVLRWSGRSTQAGPFAGFPASGNQVLWTGINAFRFACGVVVEGWSETNALDVLRQMGAIP